MRTLPVRIIIPVSFTILLFILTIFFIIIPLIEKNMMDGKRDSIRQMTQSALSVLQYYHEKNITGELSIKAAKLEALEQIRQMRYGPEKQDYFWINDMSPVMIMHPYRTDLENKEIASFQDPTGKHLFLEMVKVVKQQGDGYVDYLWQWKSDADRIVPKISYVKKFEPWEWIVGTGIYVEDVKKQISSITRQLTATCLMIMSIFLTLSGYIIWRAVKVKKGRQRAMEQARIREKQLLQADKMSSLGVLVAGVAHEINNPATSLMLNAPNLKKAWQSFTPVLDDHFKEEPEKVVCAMPYYELKNRVDSMLKAIEDGAARIKKIISELKDFSRPVGTAMDDDVDINLLVEKSVDLLHTLLKKSTHSLTIQTMPELPSVRGNFQKLQQVVINLLVNAAQAVENKDQAITILTSLEPHSNHVSIEIKDDGPGVPPEDLQHLTDPFFTTKRDQGGTGLGLSISEKIVHDHQGVLEFQSTEPRGFSVKILLPLR